MHNQSYVHNINQNLLSELNIQQEVTPDCTATVEDMLESLAEYFSSDISSY